MGVKREDRAPPAPFAGGFPDQAANVAVRQMNAVEIPDGQDGARVPGGHRVDAPDDVQGKKSSKDLNGPSPALPPVDPLLTEWLGPPQEKGPPVGPSGAASPDGTPTVQKKKKYTLTLSLHSPCPFE
jgi:hypothetical protein